METKKEQPGNPPDLHFGGGGIVAVVGTLSGVAIALGGPAVLLSLGQSLGPAVLTTLVVISLAGGALVALTSAFFGLVIPRHLRGGPWMDPDKWRRFAREQRRWHHGPGHWRGGRGAWDEDEDLDQKEEEAEAAALPKRRPRR